MRKLILFMHVSLDGLVQGGNDWDINWISFDHELEKYAQDTLSTVDTVLWGRSTYQGMQQYWTSVPGNPEASEYEKQHASWIDKTLKVVFSTTMESADWNNSKLVRENIGEEIFNLKNQPGKDMIILGSPRFAHNLMQLGLIDEYRINVNPIVLGEGMPLFKDLRDGIHLELIANKTLNSGVVGLVYRLKNK
jgi:dihydrofolate reductase